MSIWYLKNEILELIVDGDKSLIVFNSFWDVKGIVIFIFIYKFGFDD